MPGSALTGAAKVAAPTGAGAGLADEPRRAELAPASLVDGRTVPLLPLPGGRALSNADFGARAAAVTAASLA